MTETDKTVVDEYFIPIEGKEELPLPASYTEPLETLDSSELASFTLKPARNRFLKPFMKLAALTFITWSSGSLGLADQSKPPMTANVCDVHVFRCESASS